MARETAAETSEVSKTSEVFHPEVFRKGLGQLRQLRFAAGEEPVAGEGEPRAGGQVAGQGVRRGQGYHALAYPPLQQGLQFGQHSQDTLVLLPALAHFRVHVEEQQAGRVQGEGFQGAHRAQQGVCVEARGLGPFGRVHAGQVAVERAAQRGFQAAQVQGRGQAGQFFLHRG